jgi:Ca2+-binding RTX toxin-like protein
MRFSCWLQSVRGLRRQRPQRRRRVMGMSRIEGLEDRTLLSVVSVFDPVAAELSIDSDAADAIEVTVDDSGEVAVNGSSTGVLAADVKLLDVEGGPGDNLIDVSAVSVADFAELVDVSVSGGDGSDHLIGSEFDDHIDGGAGDDSLEGGGGNDDLRGRSGNDVINGGSGDDVVNGGSGDDHLDGGLDNDRLLGGRGDDILTGNAGDDILKGHGGRDRLEERADVDFDLDDDLLIGNGRDEMRDRIESADLSGGESANRIDASDFTGRTTLRGAGGDDHLLGGRHDDRLEGDDGNDVLNGGRGRDDLDGGNDDDRLLGGTHNDVLSSGLGNDIVNGQGGVDRLSESGDVDFILDDSSLSGVGNDRLRGIEIAHLIGGLLANTIDASAFNGATVLEGGAGNDLLLGGLLRDILDGGDGDDELHGGSGPDLLHGGPGRDALHGDDDDDRLNGGSDDDELHGNDGSDRLLGGGGADIINGGLGDDILRGHGGDDELRGGDGDDDIHGGRGKDRAHGGSGRDRVRGGDDDDVLEGDDGQDDLDGGPGDDIVHGGMGDDLLHGGIGDDDLDGNDGEDLLDGDDGNDHLVGGLEVDTEMTFVTNLVSPTDSSANGEVKFEHSLDHDVEIEMEVEVDHVPEGTYDVQVDGLSVGPIVVGAAGNGAVEFSTHPDEVGEVNLPAGFAGIGVGTVITLKDGETTILEGVFGERIDFKFKVPLQAIGDSQVHGRVKYEQEGDGKVEFELRVRGVEPGTYKVLVDGVVVQAILIDASGRFELELSLFPEEIGELQLPNDFPTIGPGTVIEIEGIATATLA